MAIDFKSLFLSIILLTFEAGVLHVKIVHIVYRNVWFGRRRKS